MRVAVLSGGRSSEHEISLESGASVAAGLREAGHEVVPVLLERDGRWTRDGTEVELRAGAGLLGVDVAFPVLHGPFGEDGTVQGLLECLDVPYAGPGVLAAAISIDKLTFKRLLAFHGIPQVDFCEAGEDGWREHVAAMGLPVWVKPARLGSSVGITKAHDDDELRRGVALAFEHDEKVLVERFITGVEVEVGVLGNLTPVASMPGEIVVTHNEWYDYEAKYDEGEMDLVVPAGITEAQIERAQELAVRAFVATDCEGMARADLFVREDGEVLVNELNTIPGFTATSVYARLFEASGIPYPQLLQQLADLAVERFERRRALKF